MPGQVQSRKATYTAKLFFEVLHAVEQGSSVHHCKAFTASGA